MSESVAELVSEYVRLREQWSLLSQTPKKANKVFMTAGELAQRLRATPEGRLALTALTEHPSREVRLGAATACLDFDPDHALRVLDRLDHDDDTHSFSARIVAREWRAGRLNVDW